MRKIRRGRRRTSGVSKGISRDKKRSNRREKGLWDSVSDGLIKNMKANWKCSNLLSRLN